MDDVEPRRHSRLEEEEEEEGDVLFRGSQSYENGLNQVAGNDQPRRRGNGVGPPPLRKDVRPDSSEVPVRSISLTCIANSGF
jgi:hypothetical protein